MSREDEVHGFAYIVRNGYGKQFLHGGTFGKSRNVAKTNLQRLNWLRCEQRRPKLEPMALCEVRVEMLAIDRVCGDAEDSKPQIQRMPENDSGS